MKRKRERVARETDRDRERERKRERERERWKGREGGYGAKIWCLDKSCRNEKAGEMENYRSWRR